MVQFRNIKVKGLMAKMSSTGKSSTITITDWAVFEELKEALLKKPNGDYPDDARMFGIGGKGIYEIYNDDEECPPDYDGTAEEQKDPFEGGDDESVPF